MYFGQLILSFLSFCSNFSGNVYQFTFGVISCISVGYCGARFGLSRQSLAVVYVCTILMMQHCEVRLVSSINYFNLSTNVAAFNVAIIFSCRRAQFEKSNVRQNKFCASF